MNDEVQEEVQEGCDGKEVQEVSQVVGTEALEVGGGGHDGEEAQEVSDGKEVFSTSGDSSVTPFMAGTPPPPPKRWECLNLGLCMNLGQISYKSLFVNLKYVRGG